MTGTRLVALRGDEADLYAHHHRRLRRIVAGRVRMSADLVEEACQQAWLILLRRQPDRGPTLLAWLVTVAIHEGYRLSAIDRRDASLDAPAASDDERSTAALTDHLAADGSVDDSLEARRALRALAALDGRQRRYVTLRVAGLSYTEIAELEGVTYTNVNKHLVKARRRLKDALEDAASPSPVASTPVGRGDRRRGRRTSDSRASRPDGSGPCKPCPYGVRCADR